MVVVLDERAVDYTNRDFQLVIPQTAGFLPHIYIYRQANRCYQMLHIRAQGNYRTMTIAITVASHEVYARLEWQDHMVFLLN